MTSNDVSAIDLTIFSVTSQSNGGTLNVTPTSLAHIGSYSLQIVGTLPSPYNDVSKTLLTSFTINVIPCVLSAVTLTLQDQTIPYPLT